MRRWACLPLGRLSIRYGRLAQLAERLAYTEEAVGSNPSPPTTTVSTAPKLATVWRHIALAHALGTFSGVRPRPHLGP